MENPWKSYIFCEFYYSVSHNYCAGFCRDYTFVIGLFWQCEVWAADVLHELLLH